jgi:hypothetical protein
MGWVVTTQRYDVLLAMPILATPLAFRYLWEQSVINILGDYLQLMEREIFPALIGKRAGSAQEHEQLWIGWQHYFQDHYPRLSSYLPAVVILFIVLPFGPAICYSAVSVFCHLLGIQAGWASQVPLALHVAVLVAYPLLGSYLCWKLVKV